MFRVSFFFLIFSSSCISDADSAEACGGGAARPLITRTIGTLIPWLLRLTCQYALEAGIFIPLNPADGGLVTDWAVGWLTAWPRPPLAPSVVVKRTAMNLLLLFPSFFLPKFLATAQMSVCQRLILWLAVGGGGDASLRLPLHEVEVAVAARKLASGVS